MAADVKLGEDVKISSLVDPAGSQRGDKARTSP